MKDIEVPLNDAIEKLKKAFPFFSVYALGKAIRDGKIEHKRSGDGSRARIFIKISVLTDYVSKLNRKIK